MGSITPPLIENTGFGAYKFFTYSLFARQRLGIEGYECVGQRQSLKRVVEARGPQEDVVGRPTMGMADLLEASAQ